MLTNILYDLIHAVRATIFFNRFVFYQSPRRTFSPKAAADEPTARSLATPPKLFQLGNLQHAMLSGVKGWSAKSPEEKNEAVRWEIRDEPRANIKKILAFLYIIEMSQEAGRLGESLRW